MTTNNIRLRPDRLNVPLAACVVGRLSSAVFTVAGDVPDDIGSMTVQIGRAPDPDTGKARKNVAVAATPSPGPDGQAALGRTFRCYLSPFCFPDVSDALEYHVIGTDAQGNPRWLGTGPLVVKDSPADGSPAAPEVIPADTYIRNPATGLYHLLTATVDEDGNITLNLDEEGTDR